MLKTRIAIAAGFLAAAGLVAGPGRTHANSVAAAGCSGAPTAISAVNLSFTGRGTDELPTPLQPTVPPAISIVGTENPPIVLPAPVTSVTITTTAPMEYGLLNYIGGVNPVTLPGAENEISEYFTFSSTVTTSTDMPSGVFNSSVRSGTFTLYLGHGDFSNPSTFTNGTPILTASLAQTILVPSTANVFNGGGINGPSGLALGITGVPGNGPTGSTSVTATTPSPSFTSTGTLTITSSSPFTYGGTCYQLGSTGQMLTLTSVGQFDNAAATSANINGSAKSAGA